ncbi:calcium channel protein [Gonapodya sp. JEL0774]|nr:calcium channel protein [Gonapodya sp. JEL0774]
MQSPEAGVQMQERDDAWDVDGGSREETRNAFQRSDTMLTEAGREQETSSGPISTSARLRSGMLMAMRLGRLPLRRLATGTSILEPQTPGATPLTPSLGTPFFTPQQQPPTPHTVLTLQPMHEDLSYPPEPYTPDELPQPIPTSTRLSSLLTPLSRIRTALSLDPSATADPSRQTPSPVSPSPQPQSHLQTPATPVGVSRSQVATMSRYLSQIAVRASTRMLGDLDDPEEEYETPYANEMGRVPIIPASAYGDTYGDTPGRQRSRSRKSGSPSPVRFTTNSRSRSPVPLGLPNPSLPRSEASSSSVIVTIDRHVAPATPDDLSALGLGVSHRGIGGLVATSTMSDETNLSPRPNTTTLDGPNTADDALWNAAAQRVRLHRERAAVAATLTPSSGEPHSTAAPTSLPRIATTFQTPLMSRRPTLSRLGTGQSTILRDPTVGSLSRPGDLEFQTAASMSLSASLAALEPPSSDNTTHTFPRSSFLQPNASSSPTTDAPPLLDPRRGRSGSVSWGTWASHRISDASGSVSGASENVLASVARDPNDRSRSRSATRYNAPPSPSSAMPPPSPTRDRPLPLRRGPSIRGTPGWLARLAELEALDSGAQGSAPPTPFGRSTTGTTGTTGSFSYSYSPYTSTELPSASLHRAGTSVSIAPSTLGRGEAPLTPLTGSGYPFSNTLSPPIINHPPSLVSALSTGPRPPTIFVMHSTTAGTPDDEAFTEAHAPLPGSVGVSQLAPPSESNMSLEEGRTSPGGKDSARSRSRSDRSPTRSRVSVVVSKIEGEAWGEPADNTLGDQPEMKEWSPEIELKPAAKRRRTRNLTLHGKSFGVFGPENRVRLIARDLVTDPLLSFIVLACLFLNWAALAAQSWPYLPDDPDVDLAFQTPNNGEVAGWIVFACQVVYTIESILKMIVYGVVFHHPSRVPTTPSVSSKLVAHPARQHREHPYLRTSFNRLDFVVVVAYWAGLACKRAGWSGFRVLMAIAGLRPVRLLGMTDGIAVLAVLTTQTLDNWSDIIYAAQDGSHEIAALYFVAEALLVTWTVVQLFVAVIRETFGKILLGLRSFDSSVAWSENLKIIGAVVTTLFDLELLLQFASHVPNSTDLLADRIFRLDLAVSVVATVSTIPTFRNERLYDYLTIFRILRTYRIVLFIPRVRNLFATVFRSTSGIANVTLFTFVSLSIIATTSSQLLGGFLGQTSMDTYSMNYDNVFTSWLSAFIIMINERWTVVLFSSLSVTSSVNSIMTFGAGLIIILNYFFANYVLLNLFIAVILENFELDESEKISLQQARYRSRISGKRVIAAPTDDVSKPLMSRMWAAMKAAWFDISPEKDGTKLSGEIEEDPDSKAYDRYAKLRRMKIAGIAGDEPSSQDLLDDLQQFDSRHLLLRDSSRAKIFAGPSGLSLGSMDSPRSLKLKDRGNTVDSAELSLNALNDIRPGLSHGWRYYVDLTRRFCQFVVGSPTYYNDLAILRGEPISSHARRTPFNIFMFLVVLGSVVVAAKASPWERRQTMEEGFQWYQLADYIFLGIFTLEFVLRVVADGFFSIPFGYARSGWNLMDLFVLLTYYPSVFWPLNESTGLPSMSPSARDILVTLGSGFPKLFDAFTLTCIAIVPCAIYGLYLFEGRLYSCNDTDPSILTAQDCIGEFIGTPDAFNTPILIPRTWENPQYFSYDNFGQALLTVFQLASTEGWTQEMFFAMNVVGIDKQPQSLASPHFALYYVGVLCIASILGLNLFVGIMVNHFELMAGTSLLTNDQRRWLDLQRHLSLVRPSGRSAKPDPRKSPFKSFCYDLVADKNSKFQTLVTSTIIFNAIIILSEFDGNPTWTVKARAVLYTICCTIYMVDVFFKLVAVKFGKFWNVYDLICVSGGFTTSVLVLAVADDYAVISVQKVFLILITFRLVERLERIALPSLLNVVFIICMVFLVYGFMEIFGITRNGDVTDNHANFWNFGNSLLTLFRIISIDDWQRLFHDLMLEPPYCYDEKSNYLESDCGSTEWSLVLVLSFFVLTTYLLLNLFVVVIVSYFSYTYQQDAVFSLLGREDIREFKRAWASVDKHNSGFVSLGDLPKLLSRLTGKFKVRIYDDEFRIPEIMKRVFTRPPANPAPVPLLRRTLTRTGLAGIIKPDINPARSVAVNKDWSLHDIPLQSINDAVRKLGEAPLSQDVYLRRLTYNYVYGECARAARLVHRETGVDKGVPFSSVLKILAYELVDLERSLQIEELVERRRFLTQLYVSMAAEKIRGFVLAAHYRRRFLGGKLDPAVIRARREESRLNDIQQGQLVEAGATTSQSSLFSLAVLAVIFGQARPMTTNAAHFGNSAEVDVVAEEIDLSSEDSSEDAEEDETSDGSDLNEDETRTPSEENDGSERESVQNASGEGFDEESDGAGEGDAGSAQEVGGLAQDSNQTGSAEDTVDQTGLQSIGDAFPEYPDSIASTSPESATPIAPIHSQHTTVDSPTSVSHGQNIRAASLPLPPIPSKSNVNGQRDTSVSLSRTTLPIGHSSRSTLRTVTCYSSSPIPPTNSCPIPPESPISMVCAESPTSSPAELDGHQGTAGNNAGVPLSLVTSAYLPEPVNSKQDLTLLAFGFLPWALLNQLCDTSSWKVRATAVDALHRFATNIPDACVLMPHLLDFLKFSQTLLQDPNFKIALTALHVLRDLLPRLPPEDLTQHLHHVIATLTVTLGDPKVVLRQTTALCVLNLMHRCGAKEVVACCMQLLAPPGQQSVVGQPSTSPSRNARLSEFRTPGSPLSMPASFFPSTVTPQSPSPSNPHESRSSPILQDNPRIREGLVNLACTALLTFPPSTLDFPTLLADLLHPLRDRRARVSQAARECAAAVSRVIGVDRCLRMLREYGLESSLLAIVATRLEDFSVARLNSEGLVEQVSNGATRPGSSVEGDIENSMNSPSPYAFSHHVSAPATASLANRGDIRSPSPALEGTDLWSARGMGVKSAPAARFGEGFPLDVWNQLSQDDQSPRRPNLISDMMGSTAAIDNRKTRESSGSGSMYRINIRGQLPSPLLPDSHSRRLSGKFPWDQPIPARSPTPTFSDSTLSSSVDSLGDTSRRYGSDGATTANDRVRSNTGWFGTEKDTEMLKVAGKGVGMVGLESDSGLKIERMEDSGGTGNDRSLRGQLPSLSEVHRTMWDEVTVGGIRKPVLVADLPPLPVPSDSATPHTFSPSFRHKVAVRTQFAREGPVTGSLGVLEVTGSAETFNVPGKNGKKGQSPAPQEPSPMKKQSLRKKALSSPRRLGEVLVSTSPERVPTIKLSSKPEQDLARAAQVLKSGQDWDFKCRALETMSSVLREHSELFQPGLHDRCLTIVSEVNNLRSTVSKYAISLLADMFLHLGKAMDTELDVVLGALLKKVGENSSFLVDEVDRALECMMDRVTSARCIAVLSNSFDHKNAAIKAKASTCIARLVCAFSDAQVAKYVSGQHDMDKLLPALVALSKEGLGETRNSAKTALAHLARAPDFERMLDKVVSATNAKEVREAIRSVQSKTFDRSSRPKIIAKVSPTKQDLKFETRAADSRLKDSGGDEITQLKEIFDGLGSTDFKVRVDSLSLACEVVEENAGHVSQQDTVKLFDHLAERCRDGNSKVLLLALQTVGRIVPMLGSLVDPVSANIVPVLVVAQVSASPAVRSAASESLTVFAEAVTDGAPVLQALTAVAQFNGNLKMRAVAGESLAILASILHAKSPRSFLRHTVPASISLMSSDRPEARQAGVKLFRALAQCVGSEQLTDLVTQSWPELVGKVRTVLSS